MKKIINRKIYDTEASRYLGSWHNYSNTCEQSLYCTKSGQYFLTGELFLLSEPAAKEWAKEHLTTGQYFAIFSEWPAQ